MVSINLLPTFHLASLIVEDVLGSYTLPHARAARIRRLALNRFQSRPDLEAIYLYIDGLVEGGIKPEDFFQSLDRPDLVTAPGAPPGAGSEDQPNLSWRHILDFISDKCGPWASDLLSGLLARAGVTTDSESPVTRERLETDLESIAARLSRVRSRLEKCGVLWGNRPVARVDFESEALFEYTGNYVNAVDDEKARRMFEAHRQGLSLNCAARFAGVARDTVQRWWRAAGLEEHHLPFNAIPEDRVATIVDAFAACSGNAARAARRFGVASSTVLRLWRDAGLTPNGRAPALTPDQVRDLVAAHARFGGNATVAAEKLGLAPSTVRKYWKKSGLRAQRPGRPRKA